MRPGLDGSIGVALHQPEVFEPGGERAGGGEVEVAEVHAGPGVSDGLFFGAEDDLVDGPLLVGERAADGDRPGDVRGVAVGGLDARVEQQKLPLTEGVAPGVVVEYLAPDGCDRLERDRHPVAQGGGEHRRVHLGLAQPGPGDAHRLGDHLRRHGEGGLDLGDLALVLHRPQAAERPHQVLRRALPHRLDGFAKQVGESEKQPRHERRRVVDRSPELRLGQHALQLADVPNLADPGLGSVVFGRRVRPVPEQVVERVGRGKERVGARVGVEQQRDAGPPDAGQVKQMRGLPEGMRVVGVAPDRARTGDQNEAAADGFAQGFAAGAERVGGEPTAERGDFGMDHRTRGRSTEDGGRWTEDSRSSFSIVGTGRRILTRKPCVTQATGRRSAKRTDRLSFCLGPRDRSHPLQHLLSRKR